MTGAVQPIVPNLVRDALERDGAYDFGLGVVLPDDQLTSLDGQGARAVWLVGDDVLARAREAEGDRGGGVEVS